MSKKTVLVTGGTRGIGKAISKRLAQDGFEVFFTGRSGDSIDSATSGQAISLDLAKEESVEKFVRGWTKPLFALINNAAICETSKLGEPTSFSIWNKVIQVNLTSTFYLTNELLGRIQKGGRIVNISSQLGVEGRGGYGAYCASKFAINGLTKVWAKELGERGINVNSICPGWVETEMTMSDLSRIAKEKNISEKQMYQEICAPLELKRMNKPEEVAGLVSFLLGPDGGAITGRDLLLQTIWNEM
ncbi:MAG: SDR family oxidoreductase [Bdellovibrionales bacterium]|nr:SDR family oxidoreductase [Bdellovibrionales bacterium]